MKTILAAVAATVFAASASASGIYSGFGQANPDIHNGYAPSADEMAAAQPGVGSNFGRYHGWADGNADLFRDNRVSSSPSDSGTADVYRGFEGNPDL